MSKGHWKKYDEIYEEILKILKFGEIMTAHVIWFTLKTNNLKISYGAVNRKLLELEKLGKIECIENLGSNQKIWKINDFLND